MFRSLLYLQYEVQSFYLQYVCSTVLSFTGSLLQMALADSVIGELHLLEQMSSDEHLGSLAEAVLEAVKGHAEAAKRVDQVSDLSRTYAIKQTL